MRDPSKVRLSEAATCLNYNLRRTSRLVNRYYEQALKPAGLRAGQFNLMVAVGLRRALLEITDATLAGISIGGTIALLMAAQQHPGVKKVVAINAYDYGGGGGLRRSSRVANLIFGLGMIPVLGETVMRFRNRMVERPIFEGGVAEPDAIPAPLLEELYLVGTRPVITGRS